MLDTLVEDTQLPNNTNAGSDLDDSDDTIPPSNNNSSNSDSTKSPYDESGDDQSPNSDNDADDRGKLLLFLDLCHCSSILIFFLSFNPSLLKKYCSEIVRRGPAKMGFEWGTGKVM